MLGISSLSNDSWGGYLNNPKIALEKELSNSVVNPVFIAELTAGQTINVWYGSAGTYYTNLTDDNIFGVRINGVDLIEMKTGFGSSSALNRFHYARNNKRLTIRVANNPNNLDQFVQAIYKFHVADKAIDRNDTYYEGMIVSLPALSLRLDVTFGSIVQIGGGALQLLNENSYWDSRSDYEWQAGECNIYLGTVDLPFVEFVQVGSWSCDYVQKTNETFTVNLIEKKTNIDVSVPFNIYTQDEYPNLRNDDIGKVKPWAYGPIYGAEAICKDITNGTFTVADHSITSIDAVRVLNNQAWVNATPVSMDLPNASFVLASGDWTITDNQKVSVDFTGKPKINGYLMNNAADIVEDIFVNLGLDNLDYNSFSRSESILELGYYGFKQDDKACQRVPSVYVNTPTQATEVFQTINEVTNAYLFMDGSGKYRYQVFEPMQENSLVSIMDEDILSFEVDSTGSIKNSKVVVNFAKRIADDYTETAQVAISGNQFLRNQKQPVIDTRTVDLVSIEDASRYGQQLMLENQYPPIFYMVEIKWGAWILTAGDFVHFTYSRHGIDLILEIQEINYDLTNRTVKLILSTMHGLSGRQSFWVQDDSNFNWSNTSSSMTKVQMQQNSGHWHTDLFVATSGIATNQDYKISVWN